MLEREKDVSLGKGVGMEKRARVYMRWLVLATLETKAMLLFLLFTIPSLEDSLLAALGHVPQPVAALPPKKGRTCSFFFSVNAHKKNIMSRKYTP